MKRYVTERATLVEQPGVRAWHLYSHEDGKYVPCTYTNLKKLLGSREAKEMMLTMGRRLPAKG